MKIDKYLKRFDEKFPTKTVSYPGCLTLTNALDRQRNDEIKQFLSQSIKEAVGEALDEVGVDRVPVLLKGDWERDKSGKPIMGTLGYDKGSFRENIGFNRAVDQLNQNIKKVKQKYK